MLHHGSEVESWIEEEEVETSTPLGLWEDLLRKFLGFRVFRVFTIRPSDGARPRSGTVWISYRGLEDIMI